MSKQKYPGVSDMEESSPIISALSEELNRALRRVEELEIASISSPDSIGGLPKRCLDDRAMLKDYRQQESKVRSAVVSITEELEKERIARKRLQMENKMLSRSLLEANRALRKTEKVVYKEREARKLLEHVCNELATEMREDKAKMEELKRKNARDREEIEEERRALLLIEAWREERVQMKLTEAKLEVEERCMALDKLKAELYKQLDPGSKLESTRLDPNLAPLSDFARCYPDQCQGNLGPPNDVIHHSSQYSEVEVQQLVNSKPKQSRAHVSHDIYSSKLVGDESSNACIDSCHVNFMQQCGWENRANMHRDHFNHRQPATKDHSHRNLNSEPLTALHADNFSSNPDSSQESDWENPKLNNHVQLPLTGTKNPIFRKGRDRVLHFRENGFTKDNHGKDVHKFSESDEDYCDEHYCDDHRSDLEEEGSITELDDEDDALSRAFPKTKKQTFFELNSPYVGHNHFEARNDSYDGLPPVPLNSPINQHSDSPDFHTRELYRAYLGKSAFIESSK